MLRRMAFNRDWVDAARKAAAGVEDQTDDALDGLAEWRGYQGDPGHLAGGVAHSSFLMTLGDIFAMPDPIELVKGMLIENENISLVGQPKAGKTFVALDIALSLAAGVPVLGCIPVNKSGAVVYLTGEGKASFKSRIKAWMQARNIPADTEIPFFFKASVPMTAEGSAEARKYVDGIRKQLGGAPVILTVIDTMARSLGTMNENEAATAAAYLNMTEEIREGLGTTTLTLAHASDKAGAGVLARGSSGFGAGFDTTMTLQMDKQNKTAKMSVFYMRAGKEDDYGPWCFRLQEQSIPGMEKPGAALKLVPLSDWEFSRETKVKSSLAVTVVQIIRANEPEARTWDTSCITTELLADWITTESDGERPTDPEDQARWDGLAQKTEAALRDGRKRAWGRKLSFSQPNPGSGRRGQPVIKWFVPWNWEENDARVE
jgi:hypothetical protein